MRKKLKTLIGKNMEKVSQNKFKAAYKELNHEQKQAVETIEGPVMVIAGPGTGKTHLLTMRIANILAQTDTPPEAILALTFTESPALRLLAFLQVIVTLSPSTESTVHLTVAATATVLTAKVRANTTDTIPFFIVFSSKQVFNILRNYSRIVCLRFDVAV